MPAVPRGLMLLGNGIAGVFSGNEANDAEATPPECAWLRRRNRPC
jgi:hypothetical protein